MSKDKPSDRTDEEFEAIFVDLAETLEGECVTWNGKFLIIGDEKAEKRVENYVAKVLNKIKH